MNQPHHFFCVQLKMAIILANSRNDLATIRDALEVSAEMYRKTQTMFKTMFSVIYCLCQYGRSFGMSYLTDQFRF